MYIPPFQAEKRGDARAVGVPPFKQMHPKMPVLRSNPPSRPNAVPPFQALPPVVARMSPVPPSVNKLSGVRAQTAFRNAIKTVNHQFMKPQPVSTNFIFLLQGFVFNFIRDHVMTKIQ
jgi:hypothetical protein